MEHALASCNRLVLRGPAGSGKSTLVRWLALNAARQGFGSDLGGFNRCVPFVLRLRSFNTPDGLPMPEDFLTASGIPLRAPQGWIEELLCSGRALVLGQRPRTAGGASRCCAVRGRTPIGIMAGAVDSCRVGHGDWMTGGFRRSWKAHAASSALRAASFR
ncbi:NACHT domain-containing protein [Streptomyces sp. NPDC006333]|uniref:NACHT domain-containing protein n=1 Tax=Streptomyces sp. NPDC006333 TaxID=3156753 RepID=UPI0033A5256B